MKSFHKFVVICLLVIYLSVLIFPIQPAAAKDDKRSEEWGKRIDESKKGGNGHFDSESHLSTLGPLGVSMSLVGTLISLAMAKRFRFGGINYSVSRIAKWFKAWKCFGVMVSTIVVLYYTFNYVLGSAHYSFVASIAGNMLNLAGADIFVEGNSLFVPVGDRIVQLIVSWECAATVSYIVYVALVLALPGVHVKGRILGLVFGIPAIFATNLLRIFFIAFGAYNYPSISLFIFHDFFGVPFAFFTMMAIWFVWFYYALFKKLTPASFDSG